MDAAQLRARSSRVHRISVDLVDGSQYTIDREDTAFGPGGQVLGLWEAVEALSDPDGWVDLLSYVQQRGDEGEEWADPPGPVQTANLRIFGRGVISISTIFAEIVESPGRAVGADA